MGAEIFEGMMDPIQIAEICHEANKDYCTLIGDRSQLPWNEAEQWQRDSALAGVMRILHDPKVTPAQLHEAWLADKLNDGWRFGLKKDPGKKEHPCCLPYDKLPLEQRRKDNLFRSIVLGFMDED